MTWKEAIRKVLQEEGGPLHYTDITSRIFENGYRKKEECGATPDQTVCAQLATKKDMFLKLGNGIYKLVDKSETIADKQSETKEDRKQIAEEEKLILKDNIIKNFGMYWNRCDVNWKTMNLYGTNGGAVIVNFKEQKGIYLLHDAREVIYVGKSRKTAYFKATGRPLQGQTERTLGQIFLVWILWRGRVRKTAYGRLQENEFYNGESRQRV